MRQAKDLGQCVDKVRDREHEHHALGHCGHQSLMARAPVVPHDERASRHGQSAADHDDDVDHIEIMGREVVILASDSVRHGQRRHERDWPWLLCFSRTLVHQHGRPPINSLFLRARSSAAVSAWPGNRLGHLGTNCEREPLVGQSMVSDRQKNYWKLAVFASGEGNSEIPECAWTVLASGCFFSGSSAFAVLTELNERLTMC